MLRFLCIATSIYCIYLMVKRIRFWAYWNKRKVPGVKDIHYCFGSYKKFVLNEGGPSEVKWIYDLFLGHKYFGLSGMFEHKLVICDPDLIKQILEKDFDYFINRTKVSNRKSLYHDMFIIRNEEWKNTRQTISPAFTMDELKNMFHIVVQKCKKFENFIKVTEADKKETECVKLVSRFITEIIGSYIFGIEMDSTLENETPFRKTTQDFLKINKENKLSLLIKTIYHKCTTIDTKLTSQKKTFFSNTIKETLNERQNRIDLNRNDFIDFLLQTKRKSEPHQQLINDKFITEQALTFLSSGFETTSSLCGFVLHELAYNWKVQEKVYREIVSVLDRHNGELSYDAVSEMAYLETVVLKGMRMYPPLPVLTRVCNKTYKVPGSDLVVDVGMKIIIPIYGIHWNTEYYPDPDKFVPERFDKEEIEKRHPMTYLPFGYGPRDCIGLVISI